MSLAFSLETASCSETSAYWHVRLRSLTYPEAVNSPPVSNTCAGHWLGRGYRLADTAFRAKNSSPISCIAQGCVGKLAGDSQFMQNQAFSPAKAASEYVSLFVYAHL